jgi:hypothetical protein
MTGFSRDVCAILLIANITRCFYWLGNRFEFALLLQSIFMIVAQVRLTFPYENRANSWASAVLPLYLSSIPTSVIARKSRNLVTTVVFLAVAGLHQLY